MKRLSIVVVLSLLGALIVAMVTVAPASADKPAHWTDFTEFDWTYENCVMDGEPVIIPGHLKEYYYLTGFFDKNGDLTKIAILSRGIATLTYNGHTLTMHDVIP